MAFDAQGVWHPEDDQVATRLTGLLKVDNDLMKQAQTQAKQYANRRGLLNSSIAAGAGVDSMLRVALPIASQEASQTAQKNLASMQFGSQKELAGMDIGSREKIAGMNIAANDREKAAAATAAMQNLYGEAFRTVAQQHELPAAARNAYLDHLRNLMSMDLNLVEQLYGIDLDFAPPATPNV